MNLKESIGLRVKIARRAANLSQDQLSELIERTTETVSNIERAVSVPNLETLDRLSKVFNVPLLEFFEGCDHPVKDKKRNGLEMEIREALKGLSASELIMAKKLIQALIEKDEE